MKAYTLLTAVLLVFISPLAFSAEGGRMTHHPDMKGGGEYGRDECAHGPDAESLEGDA
jgi:hypothetical protein